MTADLVQNSPQTRSIPSRTRSMYDHGLPLTSPPFSGNRGDLNMGAGMKAIADGSRDKEIGYMQDEPQKREGGLSTGNPLTKINSKDGGADLKGRAPVHASMQVGTSEQHDRLPLPAESRHLQLESRAKVDELQGKPADKKVKCTDQGEGRPSIGFKSNTTTVVPQIEQFQHSHLQYPQQGMSGGWENFLSQRNLRILLVEDDDSTRHVVGALLRNCGYEVTMAASGGQAWQLMQDKNNHFDLALTEVMLPSLSGISLLSKIMNQESCKHLPVVMMSTLDSLDVVFKCLSKGAVDFLVKPVRKNELKNLWQHVWRKCHSSSGSGSGSGSQTGKMANLKSMNGSGNNSDSESSSLNIGGGSDNGSGTQSFWTNKKDEVESPGRPTVWETAQCTDVRTNAVALPNDRRRMSLDAVKGLATVQAKETDHITGKCPEICSPKTNMLERQVASGGHMQDTKETIQKVLPMEDCEQHCRLENEAVTDVIGGASTSGTKVIDLLGNLAFQSKNDVNHNSSEDGEMLDRGASNSPTTKDNVSGSISLPTLELTLKRPHTGADHDGKVEDRHVLRQSGTSAFSRYSSSAAVLHQHQHVSVGSYTRTSFPLESGYVGPTTTGITSMGTDQFGVMRTASPANTACLPKGTEASASIPLHIQVSSGINNKDMAPSVAGSLGQEVLAQPAEADGASASGMPTAITVPSLAKLSSKGVSSFGLSRNHVVYTHSSKATWAGANIPEGGEHFSQHFEDHGRPLQSRQKIYHHHSHYYHHHIQHHYHHVQSLAKPGPSEPADGQQTVTNQGTAAPQCGSSNMMDHVAGNLGQSGSSYGYGTNGNGNGSVSGSNQGSNNHNGNSNGQSCAKASAGVNGDSGNDNGNCGSGNGHCISFLNGGNGNADQNSFTRREAALNKFRQKRKERCFEKKVRYQSRKRLAEQRPRVRGQFVRQTILVSSNSEKEKENYGCNHADADGDLSDAECD